MKVGYARISKEDQEIQLQRDSLEKAGCEKIFEESASGGRFDRPILHEMLDSLKEGDVVVVWKLDRLSRSLQDLLILLDLFTRLKIGFISLTEQIDTQSPAGRMLTQMLGAFSEFERAMISERTKAGLDAAKKRGVSLGRPKALTKSQREEVKRRVSSGDWSQAEAARLMRVDKSTISRLLKNS